MIKIFVKPDSLDTAINRFKDVESVMNGILGPRQTIVGGGKMACEVEQLDEMYQELEKQLRTLIHNTIGFMQNVRDSYTEQDENIAAEFKQS